MVKKPVQHALLNLSRDIAATGSKVMVIELPEGEQKGADDYITANGKPAFEELISAAPTIEEWKIHLNERWLLEKEKAKSSINSKVARNLHLIKQGWGGFLRFNLLKNQVEATDGIFDLDESRLKIALDFDIDVPERDAISIIERIAKEQSYHPVQEYLEKVAEKYPEPDLSVLDNLATKYFGSTERLHNVYMRKTLIAAVARIYEPECKHDHVTVIVGEQGTGKSTFWKTLFGTEFFSDQLGEASKAEDDLMKLHQFWALEWSEFETVYRRKEVGQIKKFITSPVDNFRVPYARKNKDFPRQSILCGTTNETEILNDPTGSRRFWIINSTIEEIPTDQLEKERDLLWAAAYHAYSTGEIWFLDRSNRTTAIRVKREL
ncbi:MAG: VapE domain-containing protein [Gloeotrichia echinulata DVL01]